MHTLDWLHLLEQATQKPAAMLGLVQLVCMSHACMHAELPLRGCADEASGAPAARITVLDRCTLLSTDYDQEGGLALNQIR
jgi:hypothetical protein